MSKKIDTESLKFIADELNKCADSMILVYPYITISDEGLKYGNKNNIRDAITHLKYYSFQLTRVLMEELDD